MYKKNRLPPTVCTKKIKRHTPSIHTIPNKKGQTPVCIMASVRYLFFEPPAGLEPATHALRMRCSTN